MAANRKVLNGVQLITGKIRVLPLPVSVRPAAVADHVVATKANGCFVEDPTAIEGQSETLDPRPQTSSSR